MDGLVCWIGDSSDPASYWGNTKTIILQFDLGHHFLRWANVVGEALGQVVVMCGSVRIWPLQRAWLWAGAQQQSDSWSSMAPCLTLSTVCSPGRPVPLHTLKTRMLFWTPGERKPPQSLGSSSAYSGLAELELDFSPCHLTDLKGSRSRGPADCPFALSLRSGPKGPVITKLLSWRP